MEETELKPKKQAEIPQVQELSPKKKLSLFGFVFRGKMWVYPRSPVQRMSGPWHKHPCAWTALGPDLQPIQHCQSREIQQWINDSENRDWDNYHKIKRRLWIYGSPISLTMPWFQIRCCLCFTCRYVGGAARLGHGGPCWGSPQKLHTVERILPEERLRVDVDGGLEAVVVFQWC